MNRLSAGIHSRSYLIGLAIQGIFAQTCNSVYVVIYICRGFHKIVATMLKLVKKVFSCIRPGFGRQRRIVCG